MSDDKATEILLRIAALWDSLTLEPTWLYQTDYNEKCAIGEALHKWVKAQPCKCPKTGNKCNRCIFFITG